MSQISLSEECMRNLDQFLEDVRNRNFSPRDPILERIYQILPYSYKYHIYEQDFVQKLDQSLRKAKRKLDTYNRDELCDKIFEILEEAKAKAQTESGPKIMVRSLLSSCLLI